jgi:hypothetical protein
VEAVLTAIELKAACQADIAMPALFSQRTDLANDRRIVNPSFPTVTMQYPASRKVGRRPQELGRVDV